MVQWPPRRKLPHPTRWRLQAIRLKEKDAEAAKEQDLEDHVRKEGGQGLGPVDDATKVPREEQHNSAGGATVGQREAVDTAAGETCRDCGIPRLRGHNYIGHDYIGHDYIGHNYIDPENGSPDV